MDTKKAIALIQQLASVYRGTLQEHKAIQEAIMYIENKLNKKEKKK
jgi:hypothetical protein